MKNISKVKKAKGQRGIGLVETIVALGIAIIVITSLVSLSVFTLRTSNKGNLLLRGSKQANNQLELVRAYRDSTTWDLFITELQTDGCTDDDNEFDPACHAEVDTGAGGGDPSITIVSGEEYDLLSDGSSSQGTPFELSWAFEASDPDGGSISTSTQVIRLAVRVKWKIGSDDNYSYIYSDVSNWKGQ